MIDIEKALVEYDRCSKINSLGSIIDAIISIKNNEKMTNFSKIDSIRWIVNRCTVEELYNLVYFDIFGRGDLRKSILGPRYEEVQVYINERMNDKDNISIKKWLEGEWQ